MYRKPIVRQVNVWSIAKEPSRTWACKSNTAKVLMYAS